MKTRKPAVAGKFYPQDKQEIIALMEKIYEREKDIINTEIAKNKIIGAVIPHAGFIFSGYQAVHFFDLLRQTPQTFDTIFIINPSHTGYGAPISLDDNEKWQTPLGEVAIDNDFADILPFAKNEMAHKYEHSGEVLLPFLQHFTPYNYKIVPIAICEQTPENARSVAKAIYDANKRLKKRILVLASSDFSHFLPPDEGKELDDLVITEILNFNAENLNKIVRQKNISVCGYGAIMALIEYTKLVSNAAVAKVLRRGHSGEVYPADEVVNYASIVVTS